MILKCIFLALSVSIDALGLGITYGIKKTKMSKSGNLIIFTTLFFSSGLSVLVGHYLSILFSPTLAVWFGASLLILLGLYNICKVKNNVSINFDADNSNYIDSREALALALAVSVDASCVSLSSGMIGLGCFLLPIFIAIFHTFFVNCGNFIATSIIKKFNLSNKMLSIFSGIILIFIGLFRLLP